jgi:hypothetical protein
MENKLTPLEEKIWANIFAIEYMEQRVRRGHDEMNIFGCAEIASGAIKRLRDEIEEQKKINGFSYVTCCPLGDLI